MVRKYKSKKDPIDKSKMKAAVLSVRRDGMKVRAAAKLHGVKNSTLHDWLKKTSEEQAATGEVTMISKGHKKIRMMKAMMTCKNFAVFVRCD